MPPSLHCEHASGLSERTYWWRWWPPRADELGDTETHIRVRHYDSHCVMIWNNVWQWLKATMLFPPCDTNSRFKQEVKNSEKAGSGSICEQLLSPDSSFLSLASERWAPGTAFSQALCGKPFRWWWRQEAQVIPEMALQPPDTDLRGVKVRVSEHPRTWERAHENVYEWAQARVAGQCTPMLTKALSLCHLTHKKLHRQLVSWNSLSYHQVNIADAF